MNLELNSLAGSSCPNGSLGQQRGELSNVRKHGQASRLSLAMAVGGLLICSAGVSQAQNVIDPTQIILDKLKKTSANSMVPNYRLKAVTLRDTFTSDGVRFVLPSVVPLVPSVIAQSRLANCGTTVSTNIPTLSGSTTKTDSFTGSDTLGGSTSVTIKYAPPAGSMSISGTQSFNYSHTETKESSTSKTLGWEQSVSVPVKPRTVVTVQLVAAESMLKNIPWSTNLIVGPNVDLVYEKSDPDVCFYSGLNATGKSLCMFNLVDGSPSPDLRKLHWDGSQVNDTLDDKIVSVQVRAGWALQMWENLGYHGGNSTYQAGTTNLTSKNKYTSLVMHATAPIPPREQTRTNLSLNTWLKPEQMRVYLHGTYDGVDTVQADIRVSSPTRLTDQDCSAMSPGQPQVQAMGAGKAGAGAPLNTTTISGAEAKRLAPLPESSKVQSASRAG